MLSKLEQVLNKNYGGTARRGGARRGAAAPQSADFLTILFGVINTSAPQPTACYAKVIGRHVFFSAWPCAEGDIYLQQHPTSDFETIVFRFHSTMHYPLFFFVSFIPFILFAHLSLSLLVVTQIRGHISISSLPPPLSRLRLVPSIFFPRGNCSPFFPRRLASTCSKYTKSKIVRKNAHGVSNYTVVGWVALQLKRLTGSVSH